ncbi:FAD/NAD(P)-binding protein [Stenotrophomonas sp. C3(2023)]|uniref:FAD/NAD(P)-binding protein n=1 Tax=Stenotrophomonas sp. C3(2023) TaxID=3080277 RepID=UPI00293CF7D0|nr:FAD/NAD(P)-binding protein [Stenotrophomonas sp. C3(2023)]MDV3470124.1 FAD/NAD(P)-binding protein [Stenotrophomonas sp. C3(2023)]
MAYNPPMTDTATHDYADLAIIGGGAAGILVALQALRRARQALHVMVFEPASVLGQGIAYATPWPEHLLNVPAGRMSAFPDQPGDFVDYLEQAAAYPDDERLSLEARFVSRHHYARYLQQRLTELGAVSMATLQVRQHAVLAVRREGGALQLELDDGQRVPAQQVVLACGNSVRPMPLAGAEALAHTRTAEAWDYDGVRLLAQHPRIGIIGSGLSMVDSVLGLNAAGHTGQIHVFSRHALLPLPHAHGAPADFDPQPLLAMTLRQRVRALRGHVRDAAQAGIPWQSVMERIRPHGQALWCSLDEADQRRFLRHVVRYWDVHRHRIAESVHAQLQHARAEGRLHLHRARLQGVREEGAALQLSARIDAQVQVFTLDALVNATGVETRADGLRNPLLRQLLAEGIARPGPHGLGLGSDVEQGLLQDADGGVHADIAVLGSLRIGTLWESLAVPELRQQAEQVARYALQELKAAMP